MRFKPAGKQKCKHYYKRPSMDAVVDWDLQAQFLYHDEFSAKDIPPVYPDKLHVR
jgi:hypothetical protein